VNLSDFAVHVSVRMWAATS